MTMNRGLLLFDSPEPAIGQWENELGWRGMKEVWSIPGTGKRVEIDCDEDYEGDPEYDPDAEASWEVRIEDDAYHGGSIEYVAFGTFAECDAAAKRFMVSCPDGADLIESARRFMREQQGG